MQGYNARDFFNRVKAVGRDTLEDLLGRRKNGRRRRDVVEGQRSGRTKFTKAQGRTGHTGHIENAKTYKDTKGSKDAKGVRDDRNVG